MKNLLRSLFMLTFLGSLVPALPQDPNPLVVINTLDEGPGSLRNAITYANSNPGTDTIVFNIPGTGPFNIRVVTTLPAITDPVVINGFSQEGSSPATGIEQINIQIWIGPVEYAQDTCLLITAGNSDISGLKIVDFRNSLILKGDGHNKIHGNYINGISVGIKIYSSDNEIGGGTPAEGNTIKGSAETGYGIILDNTDENCARNRITGNYIARNDWPGISIRNSPDNIIGGRTSGEGNIIESNDNGISISGSEAKGNRIEGNSIKNNNIHGGINLDSPGNFIGGTQEGAGNQISNNAYFGIILGPGASDNLIRGNQICENMLTGMKIIGGKNNHIGGTEPGAGNLISGNGEDGIHICGEEKSEGIINIAEGNRIEGNYIGTDASMTGPLGNNWQGISIGSYAEKNIIGGLESGSGNVIAFNGYSGIALDSSAHAGTGNAILSNSIHSNGRMGIDLKKDRLPLQNDNGDTDTGPNNLQNFPVVTSVSFSLGFVTISGILNSIPGKNYRLQFFSNTSGDESGYGEGETYLGFVDVTTDNSGNAVFSETFPIKTTDGQLITATATDPDGNTSEFSQNILDNVEKTDTESRLINVFPNPSDGSVTVSFLLAPQDLLSGDFSVKIYDISGRLLTTLAKGKPYPGQYSVTWKGNPETGMPASHGIYFIRLKAGKVEQVRQVMMIR